MSDIRYKSARSEKYWYALKELGFECITVHLHGTLREERETALIKLFSGYLSVFIDASRSKPGETLVIWTGQMMLRRMRANEFAPLRFEPCTVHMPQEIVNPDGS